MPRKTPIYVQQQGDVKLCADYGYSVVGGCDAVCFYFDVTDHAYISGCTQEKSGCPVLFLVGGEDSAETQVEFSEFSGWVVHSAFSGKMISVALVRQGA